MRPKRWALAVATALGVWAAGPGMARADEEAGHDMDRAVYASVLVHRMERRFDADGEGLAWEAEGWIGGDVNRFWVKTEGEKPDGFAPEQAEVQALWSRTVTAFWNLQAGGRFDLEPRPRRGFLVLGVEGAAPYRVDVEAAAFLSHDGDLSARLEAETDLLLTQRLILQPHLETNLALQRVGEVGVGRGVNDIELGLRLRYEVTRKFAPYLGLTWERNIGQTARFARDEGERAGLLSFVAGIRFWF